MDLGLKGKRVLVTAASKGIGRATAELFIKEGAKVAICSRSSENLDRTINDIVAIYGTEPLSVVCDLNNEDDLKNLITVVNDTFGGVDILVNNCGGPKPGFFNELTDEDFADGYRQVLMSAVKLTRMVLPVMRNNKWGRIINITSVSVKEPIENLLLSNVFRTGLVAFAKTLSLQIGKDNITINNVAPGYTLTSRLYELAVEKAKRANKSHEEILSEMSAGIPLKRLGKPEEIAAMAVFLASEQAAYITGTTIQVDGGRIGSTL